MSSDNIQVVVRVRPLIKREQHEGSKIFWHTQSNQIYLKEGSGHQHNYTFDGVYSQEHTTYDVYEHLQPIVKAVMGGFHGTIFAYGQTASGKTFTMTGNELNPGVIPLSIEEIFNNIEESPDREFLIRVSYMEIYNENVVDLLGDVRKNLEVRENVDNKIYVENLAEAIVTSPEQIFELMREGETNRHYGSTNMNERSSRSHTIFKLIIESKERVDNPNQSVEEGAINVSSLNLVDLAGSEKAKQTGATGQRLAEGAFINKSLLSLTSVIKQLSENSGFVSYRDSKLTRILQNSLGGNSKTAIICNCTAAVLDETLSSLRFAISAKKIKNKAHVNEVLSEEAMLRRYKKELSQLKKTLDNMKKTDLGFVQEENLELQNKLAEEEKRRQDQEDKISRLTELICVSQKIRATGSTPCFKDKRKRRETWCPGKERKSLAPWIKLGGGKSPAARNFMSSHLHQSSEDIPTFKSPLVDRSTSSRLQRLCQSHQDNQNYSFFQRARNNSIPEEEDEEERDDSDLVKKRVNFDIFGDVSSSSGHAASYYDAECQTEAENNEEDDLRGHAVEMLTCELEAKNKRVSDLEIQLMEKDSTLSSLSSAFEQHITDEESLRNELWQLQQKVKHNQTCSSSVELTTDNDISSAADSSSSKIMELEEIIENLKEEAVTSNLKIEELDEIIRNLKEENCDEQKEMCETLEPLVEDLNKATKSSQFWEEKYTMCERQKQETEEEFMRLKIAFQNLEEDFQAKEEEMLELQEFTQFEKDFKNMSVLEKQEIKRRLSSASSVSSPGRAHIGTKGKDEVAKLKHELSQLRKDNADAEALYLESKKELATSRDETKLFDQEMREFKKVIEKLENEKQDFDILIEMEMKKGKRRESELTEQLQRVYAENDHVPSSVTNVAPSNEANIEELQENMKTLQNTIDDMQKQYDDLVKEKTTLIEENSKITKEKDVLANENNILQLQTDTDSQEHRSLLREKESYSEDKRLFMQEKKVLMKEQETLLKEKEELTEDKNLALHENGVLTEEVEELTREKETLCEKIEFFETRVENLAVENEKLVMERDDLSNKLELLSHDKKEENDRLCEDYEELVKKRESLEKELEEVVQSNAVVLEGKEAMAERVADLEYQLEMEKENRKEVSIMDESQCGASNVTQRKDVSIMDASQCGANNVTQRKDVSIMDESQCGANNVTQPKSLFNELQGVATNNQPKSLFDELNGETSMVQPKSLFDEMKVNMSSLDQSSLQDGLDDLTVGLTGMFPQRSQLLHQTSSHTVNRERSELEESAVKELHEDLEFEITQLKNELASCKERIQKEEGERSLLHEENNGFKIQIETLTSEIKLLQEHLKEQIKDTSMTSDTADLTNQVPLASIKTEYNLEENAINHEMSSIKIEPSQLEENWTSIIKIEKDETCQSRMSSIIIEQSQLEEQLSVLHTERINLEDKVMLLKEEKDRLEALVSSVKVCSAGTKSPVLTEERGSNTEEAITEIEKQSSEDSSSNEKDESVVGLEKYLGLEKQLEEVQSENENLLCKITEVELQTTNKVEELLQTINDLKEQNQELEIKIAELQLQLEQKIQEQETINLEHVNETNNLISQLDESKETNTNVIEKHTNEISDLENQNSELRLEIVVVKEQADSKREELESAVCVLEDEIRGKDSTIEEGKHFVSKLHCDNDEFRQQLNATIEEHTAKINVIQNENSSLRVDNENLKDELDHMKATLSDTYSASEQVEKLQGQVKELREEREVVMNSKNGIEEELERLKSEMHDVNEKHLEMEENFTQSREKMTVLENTIAKGHLMVQQYEQEAVELGEECDKLKEDKEDLEQKYEALMDKYDSHIEEIRTEHESEVQGCVDKIEELQRSTAEYERQIKDLEEDQREELQLQHQAEISRLQQELNDLQASKLELEGQLSEEFVKKEQEIVDLKTKMEAHELELANKVMELECNLDSVKQENEENLKRLQDEKDALQDQVNEWKEVIDEYNREKESDAQLIKDKNVEIDQLKIKMAEDQGFYNEEAERLMKCCDQSDTELDEMTRKYNQVNVEFDEYKKHVLSDTSRNFENAETTFDKKIEMMRRQYEEEIMRLRKTKAEANNDLDQSVCQLKGEKSRLGELQSTLRWTKTEYETLKASHQAASDRIQQLQKDLSFQKLHFREETDHLRSCVDASDSELDQKNSECIALKRDLNLLKKKLNSEEDNLKTTKLEEEKDSLFRQLSEHKMKIVMMSNQLMKAEDPFKKEIKYLQEENAHMKDTVTRFKNEIRKLKNNQSDDSMVFENGAKSNNTHMAGGSGIVNEVVKFTLQSDNHRLERELKTSNDEVKRLKKHTDSHKMMICDLKRQITEKDDKLFRYKKYYRKELNAEERDALKDVINSPRMPDKSVSKLSNVSTTMSGKNYENRNPEKEVDFLNVTSWLNPKGDKEKEDPAQCQTQ